MKRYVVLLVALCGLLWPSAGHSQDPDLLLTLGTDPNIKMRYAFNETGGSLDTLFVDWSTVYAKDAESTLAIGTPASSYWFYIGREVDGVFERIDFTSLAPPAGLYPGRFYDAHVRRDTLLLPLDPNDQYVYGFSMSFPDDSQFLQAFLPEFSVSDNSISLSVDPTFVREDAGATTIEVRVELDYVSDVIPVGAELFSHVQLEHFITIGALNQLYYLALATLTLEDGFSGTGQITLTPIPNDIPRYDIWGAEDEDLRIDVRANSENGYSNRVYIRLLDDDRPTTEIYLTVSDPVISTDGRATDVTVTGTLNGALLDESVSFSLGVMPPTTAARDTDFDIRLARLTIPAGQATGTATVRITPRNRNGGQIWLGVAQHPTIGTGSNRRIIVVGEVPIELTRQPSRRIVNIEVIPTPNIREDAGQVDVDLKVSLRDALPVDETVRFEIVDSPDPELCWGPVGSMGRIARRETDYSAQLSPLTIPAGQKEATGTLSLEIVDNSNTDERRKIWVKATLGNSCYVQYIIIEDDETPTSAVLLRASPTEIAEDSGQTTITITGWLDGSALSESLTIALSPIETNIWSNQATRDLDYIAADFEPLTIPAGQTAGTATLTITPTPNDGKEQDEVIIITPASIKITENGQERELTTSCDELFLELENVCINVVKITENGQERELTIDDLDITLKDIADASADTTPTDPMTSSLAFDAPASTILSGTVGQALSDVLPTAKSDPAGALTYRVFNLPAGLTFDATTRTISGTPTTAGQTTIEYYALSEGVSAVLTYTIDIQEKPVVIVELGGIAATPLSIREDAGEAVDITLTISLRKAAKEDAVIALAIVGPTQGKTAKLNEDFTATLPATITIPTGKTKGTAQLTLLPKNNTTADGNKAFAVEATSPSGHQALANIQIIDDESASTTDSTGDDSATPDDGEEGGEEGEDTFAFASTVDDQAYTEGTEITALVLPEATGGEGAITYRLFELPAGLVFDAATRTISGTPTAATDGAVKVAYLAQDSAGAGITLTFSITVNPTLSFGDLFGASKANPAAFALADNFPNPFNPSTTIQYALPQAADVQLTVYNVVGQSVRSLVAKHQLPGRYLVEWNATDDRGQSVSAGMYFYRLKAGEAFRQVRRMVLLK